MPRTRKDIGNEIKALVEIRDAGSDVQGQIDILWNELEAVQDTKEEAAARSERYHEMNQAMAEAYGE
tara:strand:+ start:363 stop:563 length:201 start_codon:yes stop_codon:yes gene_type:complete